jgi:hypothetical protein
MKEDKEEKSKLILDLVREFCAKKLDDEYFELAEKLLQKLLRKRSKPLNSGQPRIWAAATIHALGTINFLFDKSFAPYVSVQDLNNHFGTSKTTVAAKSKQIREMLNLEHWDHEFSTKRMIDGNPFNNLVMVDGLILPLSSLPEELQAAVRQARAEGKDITFSTR